MSMDNAKVYPRALTAEEVVVMADFLFLQDAVDEAHGHAAYIGYGEILVREGNWQPALDAVRGRFGALQEDLSEAHALIEEALETIVDFPCGSSTATAERLHDWLAARPVVFPPPGQEDRE